jgi:hypothetical protein
MLSSTARGEWMFGRLSQQRVPATETRQQTSSTLVRTICRQVDDNDIAHGRRTPSRCLIFTHDPICKVFIVVALA